MVVSVNPLQLTFRAREGVVVVVVWYLYSYKLNLLVKNFLEKLKKKKHTMGSRHFHVSSPLAVSTAPPSHILSERGCGGDGLKWLFVINLE